MHQRGVAHGDIKPSNLVFYRKQPLQPVLIDLETLHDPKLQHKPQKYTPLYTPLSKDHDGFAHDRYAIGATILHIVVGLGSDVDGDDYFDWSELFDNSRYGFIFSLYMYVCIFIARFLYA